METNFWNSYGLLIVVILLILAYFLFKDQIDSWFRGVKGTLIPSNGMSCRTTFYAQLPDGKYYNIWTSNEGTPSAPNVKYYKQEVNFNENGTQNIGNYITIPKEEFESSCAYFYEPPYAWYTSPSTSLNNSSRPTADQVLQTGGRVTSIGGGSEAGGGSSTVIIGGPVRQVQSYVQEPLFDKYGNQVNAPSGARAKCSGQLVAHPPGPYYGYYKCVGGSATFQ